MENIKVLAKNYKVEFKTLEELLEQDNDTESFSYIYGICDTSKHTIFINNELDIQEKRITLLHEVLHAIYDQYGENELFSDEEHINKVSVAIAQVLLDNNDLLSLFNTKGE